MKGMSDTRVRALRDSFHFSDVEAAFERISGIVRKTPLEQAFYLGGSRGRFGRAGASYFFKLESMQRAKSFKIRGALNKMATLGEEERARGVATISSGNHGSSVAYAASLLGIDRALVVVPEGTPASKVERIEYFGGEVRLLGTHYDEAHALGMELIDSLGMTYVDAYYDDPLIYAGQGTVAVEILEQNPEIDTIVVPVGGGGLITGIACAAKSIKPSVRIVGVQTEACPAMVQSVADDTFYEEFPIKPSLCDALVGGTGALSAVLVPELVDELMVVSEDAVARAVAFMAKEEKLVAEGGSCTVVAAVMEEPERVGGENVALVISGGNIDGKVLADVLARY